MVPKPTHCSECGKPITDDNPSYSGGGNLDYAGNWTTWALGVCCRKPITEADLKNLMTEAFRLPSR